jgi:hypothetical protein
MKMFSKIIISILLFLNLAALGQGREDKEYRLYKIRSIYRAIDTVKGYTVVEIDDSEEFLGQATDNGGSLTGYYKGDSLKKITEWIGLSNRIIENVYYFDKGKLICVKSKENRYKVNDSTETIDHTKTELIFSGRYYFSNGKFVDSILNNANRTKGKEADAKAYQVSAHEYSLLLDQRRKNWRIN